MDEHSRTSAYAKDSANEAQIARLNELLAPLQRQLEERHDEPRLPVVLIIGPPRSGTTLTSQLLASSGCFGYVSNFVARFWRAPAIGAQAELALNIRAAAATPHHFTSTHGVTEGWAEPHEFGYFWSQWFDFGQETHWLDATLRQRVDGNGLRRALASLEAVYAGPMVYKNNTWFTLQAAFLATLLPNAIFVVCRRDPFHVARSLLRIRRERLGDENLWWSIRPSSYRRLLTLPPVEQVIHQALDIESEMNRELASVPAERIVEAPYIDTCRMPARLVNEVRAACDRLGCPVAKSRPLPGGFEPTDRWTLLPDEANTLLEAAHRLIPGFPDRARGSQ